MTQRERETFASLQPTHFGVVPKQLVHAARKRKEHQYVDREELENVDHHATERDLQRTEVRIHREDVDELQRAEYVGGRKQSLGQKNRIERVLGVRSVGQSVSNTQPIRIIIRLLT